MHLFLWVLVVVELPFDDVKIAAYAFEVVVNLFDAQVPRAQDVLDLPRHEQRFELWGQIRHPVRNVQVAYAQHEHHDCCLTRLVCVRISGKRRLFVA